MGEPSTNPPRPDKDCLDDHDLLLEAITDLRRIIHDLEENSNKLEDKIEEIRERRRRRNADPGRV